MARRGRCRCGFILRFEKGDDGYKTRCPECGAVVRQTHIIDGRLRHSLLLEIYTHLGVGTEIREHGTEPAALSAKA